MKRTLIYTLIGIVAIAAVATFVNAQPGPDRSFVRGKMMEMRGKMIDALDLTDTQREKLQDLRSAHQKEMARLRADAQVAQIELRDMLRQDNPKESDIKARIADVTRAQGKVMESRIGYGLKMKQVLTAEQRQKLEELKTQNRGHRGSKDGRGRGFRRHRHDFQGSPGNFEGETNTAPPESRL